MARRGIELLRKRHRWFKNIPIEKQMDFLNEDVELYEDMIREGKEKKLNVLDAIAVLKKEQKRSRLKKIHCGK